MINVLKNAVLYDLFHADVHKLDDVAHRRYMPKLRHLHSCYLDSQDDEWWHNGFQLDIILYERNGIVANQNITTAWTRIWESSGGRMGENDFLEDFLLTWPVDYIFPTKDARAKLSPRPLRMLLTQEH